MRPYSIYISDIVLRTTYLLISFSVCWIIFFHFTEIVFLFEVFPIVCYLNQKRFIITQLTQLFSTVWLFCTILSSLFVFPLVVYHIKYFFASGWYKYQTRLYNYTLNSFKFFFPIVYFFTHLVLTPHLVSFFLYWEIIDQYSLLRIEAEISLFFYMVWIFTFKFLVSFILTNLFTATLLFYCFIRNNYLYFILLAYKKITLFVSLVLLLLLLPPDFLLQVILALLLYFLIEFFLIFICIRLFFYIKTLSSIKCLL